MLLFLQPYFLPGKSTLSGVMCHSIIRVHSEYDAQTSSVVQQAFLLSLTYIPLQFLFQKNTYYKTFHSCFVNPSILIII